jgi:hypothetical protein
MNIEELLADYSLDEIADFMVSEDYKALNELSKKTLSNYVRAASISGDRAIRSSSDIKDWLPSHKADPGMPAAEANKITKGAEKSLANHDATAKKRFSGIGKAASRLTKESEEVSFDIKQIFEGEDYSEEFKTKVSALFEAAIAEQVRAITEFIAEEAHAILDEAITELEQMALQESAELNEGLEEKIDGHLDYVVEQWMEENKLALERGIKVEMFESFVSGMKGLFESHYISVPEKELEIVEEMKNEIESLESELDEATAQNVKLRQVITEVEKKTQIEEALEGLSELNADRFRTLAEDLVFEDGEKFAKKLELVRENFFDKQTQVKKSIEGALDDVQETVLTESTKPAPVMDNAIAAYAKALSKNPSVVK